MRDTEIRASLHWSDRLCTNQIHICSEGSRNQSHQRPQLCSCHTERSGSPVIPVHSLTWSNGEVQNTPVEWLSCARTNPAKTLPLVDAKVTQKHSYLRKKPPKRRFVGKICKHNDALQQCSLASCQGCQDAGFEQVMASHR